MKKLKSARSRAFFRYEKSDLLSNLLNETVNQWYIEKHRQISINEVNFINSLKPNFCPYCKGAYVTHNHRKDGIIRYRCKSCGRTFNPLTNTLFDSHKIPISEWIEFLYHLLSYESTIASAYSNRNDKNTGYYWLKKVFLSLNDVQNDVLLEDRIYLDETYLPVMPKDVVHKNNKKMRGISRNQICIMSAVDNHGHLLISSYGKGKPSNLRILEAFSGHIKDGSVLIHDGETSHSGLVEKYHLLEEIYPAYQTKGLKDKDNPMGPINFIHKQIKIFMRVHGSYDRKNIQDWMNLVYFVLINRGNKEALETIKKLMIRIISVSKKLRFRGFRMKLNN